jgi:copper chaperone NosL
MFLALLSLIAIACSSGVDLDATPEVRIGQDVCQECGMIISEARYASAYRLTNGGQKSFDDIGDMVAHYRASDDEVAVFWVHDFNSLEWIRANEAHFVESEEISTPMGHGLAAFLNEAEAAAVARDLIGTVVTFDDLLSQPAGRLLHGVR